MSGNTSRKYKQYKIMQERRKIFGDICVRDVFGRLDLVAFGASQGRVIINSHKLSLGQVPVKSNKVSR
ncbi:hypothetical protein Q428_04665 [Fervidicella metallireducens AeB]|uniref:Uncharacterized protein n=1 Tax=Fervidicella metallireducens AeB TaxID=1403537 RepID=A0A017RXI0_9CLOT|nr:hypothetical protein [Fervidicella metallireducens]EYE89084.1 hypothetical protein Q428_04665 [Fervidicella metallireducens AeB]